MILELPTPLLVTIHSNRTAVRTTADNNRTLNNKEILIFLLLICLLLYAVITATRESDSDCHLSHSLTEYLDSHTPS